MASPDFRELTRALYEVVSAPPQQRNWDAIRHYYHREARLVRTGLNPDGTPFVSVFTLDAYIENVRTMLDGVRFSEVEVSQESVVFGNVSVMGTCLPFSFPAGLFVTALIDSASVCSSSIGTQARMRTSSPSTPVGVIA